MNADGSGGSRDCASVFVAEARNVFGFLWPGSLQGGELGFNFGNPAQPVRVETIGRCQWFQDRQCRPQMLLALCRIERGETPMRHHRKHQRGHVVGVARDQPVIGREPDPWSNPPVLLEFQSPQGLRAAAPRTARLGVFDAKPMRRPGAGVRIWRCISRLTNYCDYLS